ncbi:helicase-exonuclease AddAB subunit AddB [Oceanobacillus kimchii]|uniref:ATP-dependent helicase/deoxyribonuclease subunit B n=1 Tax=Oceanobacillus kimchii TaxID=746691 RepID=A0ABQ5THX2_9BACI|nr:helicase-exonuclease AddAB subunit AddB [Oceanobacillus kimchii]GLO65625.1 ATP-dependent helicase/deoxyribonuclease subunit B [Oceanobacillus kimchii]
MGMRFILGRSGTNKSEVILKEIKQKISTKPIGPSIFYIVPDQMTFQQEVALFSDSETNGSIRAQVVSFSRLAWRVLQETGGGTKQFISSVGIQMMLRKIIEEKQGDWNAFQKALKKQGFLGQLETMLTELKRYEITPDDLRMQQSHFTQFVHQSPSEQGLTRKLSDLIYIYETFIYSLQGTYVDSEDQLQLLIQQIKQSSILNNADIYIDGFHSFTPQEQSVLTELMKTSNSITVALTLDDREKEDTTELDLFYQPSQTYHVLKQLAWDTGIPVEDPIILDSLKGNFQNRPYFAHMEKYFDSRPAPAYEGEVPIEIFEAVHPRAEVEGVAQQVLELIRDKGYRYRDIALLIRQPEVYHNLIETIFNDYELPVFIDEKRPMLHHPLIELIRSILEVVQGNWRNDAIFRVLKTGLIPATDEEFPLTMDSIDQLENYVIEFGIRSRHQWIGEKIWKYQRFRGFDSSAQTDRERELQESMNRYRDQVISAIATVDEQLRAATTVKDLCIAVYQWLEELKIPDQLEVTRNYYDDQGLPEKGREQEQVWDAVIQLLDEMVEIAGEEKMDLSVFQVALDAGIETLQFSHVPPSMDHIIVGTIDRSRMSNIRCAFLLGVNEGVWPMKPTSDGMIDEAERLLLEQNGLKLADTSERQLLDDWFYMYLAFTVAKDRLKISYLLSDEEGKAKMPSQLIHRIEELFPATKNHILLQDPEDESNTRRFVSTELKSRSALTAQLAKFRKGYPIDPIWWEVYQWYVEHHPKGGTTHRVLQGLYYENKPESLQRDTVEQLYPKRIQASVSRIETYYRCSYQHFAKYSLNLEERRTYKLDAPDIGQLFHEALKKITEWIHAEGNDFATLTKSQSSKYANRAVTELSPVLQHQILHSSNRYAYIQKKLEEVIARAAFVLGEQARLSHFSPVGLELGFGDGNNQIPSLSMQLENGYELVLRGRIDRVDKAELENNLYLRIIDYKSSSKGLDLTEVYYGIALQMLAYLDVVLTHSEKWLGQQADPAGVLYFHVHNPMISAKGSMTEADIEEELFKQYKMQGLLLSNEEIVKMMDSSLETGSSQIIPAALKKNGGFYSYSKIADQSTFETLQKHIHQLLKSAGIDLTNGFVDVNPYQHKQQKACTYCPFHSVCQFDPVLEENDYRKFADIKENDLLQLFEREGENNG